MHKGYLKGAGNWPLLPSVPGPTSLFCLHQPHEMETMPEVLKYNGEEIRAIRTTTHLQHPSNPRSNYTMSWIIALGIIRQPVEKPYRRSRAGKSLFKRIHAIISNNKICRTSKNFGNESNLIHIQPIPSNQSGLTLSHVNIRSIRNKIPQIQEHIHYRKVDIYAITETWLKAESKEQVHSIAPLGYSLISQEQMAALVGGLHYCTGPSLMSPKYRV